MEVNQDQKQVKLLNSTKLSDHPYFSARKDAYQLADGKIVDPYFVVEMPDSATAMAITTEGEVILVEQYRHPIREYLYELPGGFIESNEKPEQGIRRELLEETGYEFDEIILLAKTTANPGVLNNFTYLFLATGGKKIQAQQLDAQEEIKVQLFSLEKVREMLKQSEIKQSMHALCLFYGFRKLELL
jgi:ADP-ribose pyrophosphatase